MSWELVWKVVLVVLLTAFGLMSVLVTINGARDVRKLLRGLQDDTDDATDGSRVNHDQTR